jgi:hypothetical protein
MEMFSPNLPFKLTVRTGYDALFIKLVLVIDETVWDLVQLLKPPSFHEVYHVQSGLQFPTKI